MRKLRRLEELDVQTHFEKLMKKWSPEYFIVVDIEDFARQKLARDGSLEQFKLQVRENKCVEKLLESANITEAKADKATKRAEKKAAKKAAKKTAKKAGSKAKKKVARESAAKKRTKKTT